ncbi:MAG: hypothetical protein J2P17_25210 [Mycobacterium sp.]|nr:hypothetical protein [Mycobacterium sp.]
MARTNATNYSNPNYAYATADSDSFDRLDVAAQGQAMDAHDHSDGNGLPVTRIATGAITSAMIADGTITAADIADASITNAKLGPDVARASLLTNGGFEVWQRGNGPLAGGGGAGNYTADRWVAQVTGSGALSVSRDTANVDSGSGACAAVTHTTGAGETWARLYQYVAPEVGAQLSGRTITFSIRVKTSLANLRPYIIATVTTYGTAHPGDGTYRTLTVTYTLTPSETGIYIGLEFGTPNGTAYIDNAMLVVGSQPANYVPLHPADDLARCQRYYETFQASAGAPMWLLHGIGTSALNGPFVPYTMQKAVTPSVTFNTTFIAILGNGGAITVTSVGAGQTVDGYRISAAAAVANGTTYLCYPNSAPATGIMASEANP